MAGNVQLGSPERRAESQAGTIIGLCIVFVTLSCSSVILRIYTRKCILRTFGPDDTAIILAQVLSFGVSITTVLQVTLGHVGYHTEFATREQFYAGARAMYSNLLVYNAAQLVTKISFLLQYNRYFRYSILQRACKFGIVFLAIWGVTQQLLTGFSCTPLEIILPQWQSRCIDTFIIFNLNSIMNMLTDFAIFLIPIWPVWRLRIPLKRKIYLLAVFCLGFFACAVSIIRLNELYRTRGASDVLWNFSATAYWSAVELNVGILCACLPTLRPLYRKLYTRLQGASDYGDTSNATSDPTVGSPHPAQNRVNGVEKGDEINTELGSLSTTKSPREMKDSFPG